MKPDIRNAPLDLWRIASEFIATFFGLFGDPEQIAMQRVFSKAAYELLLPWLRAGEWLVRELLLIEAALLGARAFRPALFTSKNARLKARAPRLGKFHCDDPEAWRVSFRIFVKRGDTHAHAAARQHCPTMANACVSPRTHAHAAARQHCTTMANACVSPRRRPPRSHYGAWGIAQRCEALLRVFNDPAAFAARLARRLFAKPARAPALLQAPPGAEDLIGRQAAARVAAAAAVALKAFDSS